MKKLSVFLCAVLLCSCAPTDYISVVPEESISGAVMSSVAPEPPDGTEKDFTEPTSYIPDSTSGGDAQTGNHLQHRRILFLVCLRRKGS